jgi:two-component system, OmpR family, sensor histidine kinase CiaH
MQKLVAQLQTQTSRLALTYLAIIMTLTVAFSSILYQTSAHQLDRQAPGRNVSVLGSDDDQAFPGNERVRIAVNNYIKERIKEAKQELFIRIFALNLLVLAGGAIFSYYLARRTLQPIESAMEAQSQFVSDASHELRTPLTALQTSNEVALRNKKLTLAQAKDVLQENINEAGKLKDLSNALLNLLQSDATRPIISEVSVQDASTNALNQVMQQAIDKNISIDDKVSNLTVLASEPGLSQVLTILLDNAIKYSPDDSTIELTAIEQGKYALITVKDKGIGIKAGDLPHIFRRFYRADKARSRQNIQGYGLGLSIAKQIVTQCGGTISVASAPEKGTTFKVTLMLARTKKPKR